MVSENMLTIDKITVEGFKSFKRKVSIPILSGFTAFTGPNGSGKSCLAESISFVFGERGLRAKKAEELIFHGSEKKGGSDHAKVAIHFNNKERVIPVQEDEVIISRKINKAGVSSYKINGKTVNKQHLLDIFCQARIQTGGHNVIHQGDVTHIIEMNPIERRKIIDEIAGIAEYEEKKQKAGKELEQVAEKLREAEIILTEKNQILERIKSDRDAAVKYKEMQEELELTRASLIFEEKEKLEKDLEDTNLKIKDLEQETVKLEKEVKESDSLLDAEEKILDDLTTKVFKANDQIELTKKMTKLESDIERKRDKIQFNEREISRLREVSSTLKGRLPFLSDLKNISGVEGLFSELIIIPDKFRVAVEVAAGGHFNDVVVDSADTAVKCVNFLKNNKLGRARFLPLDKLKPNLRQGLPNGCIDWLSDVVKYSTKYVKAVDFALGSTACVEKIEKAKEIFNKNRVRLVTLDGDLIETSGAVTGGFFQKRGDNYSGTIEKIRKENEDLEDEIAAFEKDLGKLRKESGSESMNIEVKKVRFDDRIKKIREQRKTAYENKLNTLQKLNEFNVKRAKTEASLDNIKAQWERYEQMKDKVKKIKPHELKERQRFLITQIESLGPINMKAIDEFNSFKDEFSDFKTKFDKIVEEKGSIERVVKEIEEKRLGTFMAAFNKINENFKVLWHELTAGKGELHLEDPKNIDTGLIISASPSGKRLLSIDSMSGGEKTLTALAFLFGIQRHKPSPFYILDEADAALDKANTKKLADMIRKQSSIAQFILVSHNDELLKNADQVYGISMEEGESKVIGVKLPSVAVSGASSPAKVKLQAN